MPSRSPPPRPHSPAVCRSKASAASGVKLPSVEPGKQTTRRAAASRHVGRPSGRVKSAHSGSTSMSGYSSPSRQRRAAQVLARDVDGHVTGQVAQPVEEAPGLEAAATAILDEQATRPQQFGHLRRVPLHDAELGAGRVIFIQFCDLLEQRRADLVVEVLARQFLLRGAQTAEYVGTELPLGSFEDVGRGKLLDDVDHVGSLARPMPMNCQRASGE